MGYGQDMTLQVIQNGVPKSEICLYEFIRLHFKDPNSTIHFTNIFPRSEDYYDRNRHERVDLTDSSRRLLNSGGTFEYEICAGPLFACPVCEKNNSLECNCFNELDIFESNPLVRRVEIDLDRIEALRGRRMRKNERFRTRLPSSSKNSKVDDDSKSKSLSEDGDGDEDGGRGVQGVGEELFYGHCDREGLGDDQGADWKAFYGMLEGIYPEGEGEGDERNNEEEGNEMEGKEEDEEDKEDEETKPDRKKKKLTTQSNSPKSKGRKALKKTTKRRVSNHEGKRKSTSSSSTSATSSSSSVPASSSTSSTRKMITRSMRPN